MYTQNNSCHDSDFELNNPESKKTVYVGQVAPHKKLTDNYWWNASGRLDRMGQLNNQFAGTWAQLWRRS